MAAKLTAEELAAMLGEVKATATEYDKNFCRQHLRLIKCGTEENPEELAEKKAAAAARAKLLSSVCRSKADCIKWSGGWVLLDFGCLIVHVFTEESRKFYDLERLWADARTIELDV